MNIVNIENISKIYGEKVIFDETSFGIQQGDKIGIVGINGTGKTTLLRMVSGEEVPDSGQIVRQNGLKIAFVVQNPPYDPEETVDAYALSGNPDTDWKVQSYLNQLGIADGTQKMKELSGGQRRRAAMAKVLAGDFDLLLLDEPTNHMDLVGKEALENMLKNYTGTILFVSHDRYFIKEIATGMLDFKQDKTVFYDCGYEEYLERLQKEELKQQQLLQARQEEERKEKKPEGSGNKTPTLRDVFDKKTYYNPGKILSRLKQQMAKYEKQLEESEQRLADLQMQIMDPALASDYTKLMELEEQKQKEEQNQESLLERMLETETELEEMQQQ